MATATLEFTAEEAVRLGKELYYRDILPQIASGNEGQVVAIDVRSGDYEMAESATVSAARLRLRKPDAEVFFMRVGYPTMARIL
jgi:hypothetical protein